jgi:signal transduction histidine kinase
MIARLRHKEAKLAQSEKLSLVGQLAAGIAHEINNPLGSILGYAQAAVLRLKGEGPLAEPLAAIEEEARRCRKLVQDLLAFSRQDGPLLEEISLDEVVAGVLGMVAAQARLNSISLTSELNLPEKVRADRSEVEQIVVNLCSNALDAMPKGGRLMVRTRPERGRALVEVEDNGPGIPPELRERIFEPFFTTKARGRGTGLGLALAQQIAQRHGGDISVSSEPGKGSVFTVSLPLS